MANQYWSTSQANYPQLQLEHEFQRRNSSYSQQQQDPNAFQFQPSFSSNSFQPGYGGYNTSNQQQQQQPSTPQFTFGSTTDSGEFSASPPYDSTTFNFQNTHRDNAINAGDSETRPTYVSDSPPPMMHPHSTVPSNANQTYYNPAQNSSRPGKTKRPRIPDPVEDPQDEELDAEQKDKTKPGACARCKSLKVRCEFKTDTDPCKRCLNGGHECVTPGRKKRRTPPKREHLLNQIREQAEEIQKLMAKLAEMERTKRPQLPGSGSETLSSSSPSLHSPVLSPSTSQTSYLHDGIPPPQEPAVTPEKKKDVEDWIAKARESLAEFGGIIGVGLPKSYIVEGDPEDSPSSGEEDDYMEAVQHGLPSAPAGEYEFAVVDSDADESGAEATVHRRRSRSSFHSNRSGSSTGTRKKNSGASDKLATLPSEAVPFGLMAELSLRKQRRPGSFDEEGDADGSKDLGVANDDFFRRSPAPDPARTRLDDPLQSQAPHILTRGVISPAEAENLFKTYYDKMNMSISLVDPVLYTPQRTFHRSPFLFTVICAIASRFRPDSPSLYGRAMHYAQLAAGTALISGTKNVELVMGYILLSLYQPPARRWEEERGWLYLGMGIRCAMDINLHLPNTAKPLNEHHAREQLNRTRVWLNCFNLDRSTGSQYGKPPIINNQDYTANHSDKWWKSSPYNMKHFDIHLCCYTAELRVMADFRKQIYSDPNHPTGLNKKVDLEKIATETDEKLQKLSQEWFDVLEQTDHTNVQNCFRTGLLKLAYSYSRLVALSFGFQHAFGRNHADENPFLSRCLAAATEILNVYIDDIGRPSQRVYARHGPEAQSVFVTFAAAFLVKLLQPKFASYITHEKRATIREQVKNLINHLGSAEVALDERHGPMLYSKFLNGLLNAPMAKLESASSSGPKKPARTKSNSSQNSYATDINHYNMSPSETTHTLSPYPTHAAMSFDQFAPSGGVDPYAFVPTDINALALSNVGLSDFLQPSIGFEDMSGMNWYGNGQTNQEPGVYDTNMHYYQT